MKRYICLWIWLIFGVAAALGDPGPVCRPDENQGIEGDSDCDVCCPENREFQWCLAPVGNPACFLLDEASCKRRRDCQSTYTQGYCAALPGSDMGPFCRSLRTKRRCGGAWKICEWVETTFRWCREVVPEVEGRKACAAIARLDPRCKGKPFVSDYGGRCRFSGVKVCKISCKKLCGAFVR